MIGLASTVVRKLRRDRVFFTSVSGIVETALTSFTVRSLEEGDKSNLQPHENFSGSLH